MPQVSVPVSLCGRRYVLDYLLLLGINLTIEIFSFSGFVTNGEEEGFRKGARAPFSLSNYMDDVHRNCVGKAVWLDIDDKALSSHFLSTVYLGFCFQPWKSIVNIWALDLLTLSHP